MSTADHPTTDLPASEPAAATPVASDGPLLAHPMPDPGMYGPPVPRPDRPRSWWWAWAGGGLAVGLLVGGCTGLAAGAAWSGFVEQSPTGRAHGWGAAGGRGAQPGEDASGRWGEPSDGTWTSGHDDEAGAAQKSATTATADQQVGAVTITATSTATGAVSAGTGFVLSTDGTVATNKHVVAGADQVEVTVASTGKSYTATAAGYATGNDIAILTLSGASDLDVVDVESDLAVGDMVTAVGNAWGQGELVAATGAVGDLAADITAATTSWDGEDLTDLVEFDAEVVSGDSGGPVLNQEGEVVAMTTAASSTAGGISGYAIDIDDVLTVAKVVARGVSTDAVHVGGTALLGVALDGTEAAVVGAVTAGGPADGSGLAAGDTITGFAGTLIAAAQDLVAAVVAQEPGDVVGVTWVRSDGSTGSATVTLGSGPVR